MKPFDYYNNVSTVDYPNKKEIKDKIFADFDKFVGTVAEIKKRRAYLETLVEKEYKKYLSQYKREQRKLEEEFKMDAFEELDILDNPKREKLYYVAYQKSHGFGYGDIYAEMCDLVELIKD